MTQDKAKQLSLIQPLPTNKNRLKRIVNTITTQIIIVSDQAENLNFELSPITRKTYKRYSVKLRLLAAIHKEIDPIVDSKREATLNVYRRLEDRFIVLGNTNDKPANLDNDPALLNLDSFNDDDTPTVKPLPLP